MKVKRAALSVLACMGFVSGTWATSLINTGFASPDYADGNLDGQQGWTLAGAQTNAFNVVDAAGSGFITTLGNGFDGNDTPVSLTVSSGNAIDTEWDGSIDFSLSRNTNAWNGGAVVEFGLATTSASINPGSAGDGNEWDIRLLTQNPGNADLIQIGIQTGLGGFEIMSSLSTNEAGWDGAGGSDWQTDNLRVVFNVRKTRTANVYGLSADLINLDTQVTNTGVTVYQTVSNAYVAATLDYFVIQHDNGCNFTPGNNTDRYDATIDAINLDVAAGVAPVLVAPTVSAVGGNGVVDISWNTVVDAQTYDVSRSTTSNGIYSVIAGGSGLTTTSIADLAVVNGTVYWYKVTAKSAGVADAVSVAVSATPEAVVGNQVVLDTSFTAGEGYVNADLDGQSLWKAITASNPKAFEVDPAGDGFADSEPFAAFVTNAGNDVVFSRFSSNGVGTVWSGSIAFTVKANQDGPIVTNGGNIAQIANMTVAEEFFRFGLSSDAAATDIDPQDEDDIVWIVRNDGIDNLGIGLNMRQFNVNLALTLQTDQAGWDPLWTTTNSAPDFETDLITLDWYIRTTSVANKFNGQVIANVGGSSYTGLVVYTADTLSQPTQAYAADSLQFVMGHHTAAGQPLYVSVDSVSVAHTNASPIPQPVPVLTGQQGVASKTIDLFWLGGGEEDSFNIYRSEVYGELGSLIANVPQGTASYTDDDASLQNLRSYMYTVAAVFDGGATEVYSEQAAVWALATVAPLWYPGSSLDWLGDGAGQDHEVYGGIANTVVAGNGFTTFMTGNGVAGLFGNKSIVATSDILGSGGQHNLNLCPLIFMVSQNNGADGPLRGNDGGGGLTPTIRFQYSNFSMLFWFENNVGNTGGEFDAVANNPEISYNVGNLSLLKIGTSVQGHVQIAIRNGAQWYVSESTFTRNQTGSINLLGENWKPLTVATAADTSRMTVTNVAAVAGSTLSLTQVNAIGWFFDNMTKDPAVLSSWSYLDALKVEYGSLPSAYQQWAADYNLYNDAAIGTNDYDSDGIDNVSEWGLGGNPANSSIRGIQARRTALDGGGNFLYIYPRMIATPRPQYFVTSDTDLLYDPGFQPLTEGVDFTETFGGTWATNGTGANFEVVTNAIPATLPVEFFKLLITE